MVIAQVDQANKKLVKTRVITYGVVNAKEQRAFAKDMELVLTQFLSNLKNELLGDQRALENQIRQAIRKHIFRRLKKYPTIVPVIYLV